MGIGLHGFPVLDFNNKWKLISKVLDSNLEIQFYCFRLVCPTNVEGKRKLRICRCKRIKLSFQ